MDDEAKREGAAIPESLAEKALAGKSGGKTVALTVLTVVFIAILGIHFYSSRAVDPQATAPGEQARKNTLIYPEKGSEKDKSGSGYTNLELVLPFKERRSWEYTNVRRKNGLSEKIKHVITSLPAREIQGKQIIPSA